MAVDFKSVKTKNIRSEEGKPGGTTYYVILPGEREERAICFRRMRSDDNMRCTNKAGKNTWHVGTGACNFHGGRALPNNLKTGKDAKISQMRLAGTIDRYLNQSRDKLLDLSYQLASSKAIFDEFMSAFPTVEAEDYGIALQRFLSIISTMSNLVERISRTESRDNLTAAQVLYLRATVADIIMRYINDPYQREQAARELAARMGGDVGVEMKPSEIYELPEGTLP